MHPRSTHYDVVIFDDPTLALYIVPFHIVKVTDTNATPKVASDWTSVIMLHHATSACTDIPRLSLPLAQFIVPPVDV
jgi:hypothetical protein